MVSIFSTINESVNNKQTYSSRKGSIVSISQPIKKQNCMDESHFINSYNPINGQLKFYIVQKSYKSAQTKHLSLKRGTLVQLVSKESNGLCLVRLIREVGAGLVPLDCLEEYSILGVSLPPNPKPLSKHNTLMELTPPTSPSTLKSYVFSPASVSRGSSLSVSSSITSHSKDEQETLNLKNNDVESCEVVSIFTKDSRVHYSIKITSLSKKIRKEDRFYHDFYTLHSNLIMENSKSAKVKLPCLPLPAGFKNSDVDTVTIDERITLFNNYLMELKEVIFDNKETIDLYNIVQEWFMESENNVVIKVKVLFKRDYYVMKCTYGEISSHEKLRTYLKKKISALTKDSNVLEHDLQVKTKIDGWYIVNLSNDEIYNEILPKVKETKKLVLEAIVH
mgnify:FL=1